MERQVQTTASAPTYNVNYVDAIPEWKNGPEGGTPISADNLKTITEAIKYNGKVLNYTIAYSTSVKSEAKNYTDGQDDILKSELESEISNVKSEAKNYTETYVSQNDIFVTDMKTINTLGGIGAGSDLNGLTTHDILKKLLYPYVDATVGNANATPNGGTYENGTTQTITQVSISITKKSSPITSVALYNGDTLIEQKTGDTVKDGGTITFSGINVKVFTNGNQLTVKVTYPGANGNSKTVEKKTTALTFVYPYYYDVVDADVDSLSSFTGMEKLIQEKGEKSLTFNRNNQKVVFAYPHSYGELNSIKDSNGFECIDTFSKTELTDNEVNYYVYISNNASTDVACQYTFIHKT